MFRAIALSLILAATPAAASEPLRIGPSNFLGFLSQDDMVSYVEFFLAEDDEAGLTLLANRINEIHWFKTGDEVYVVQEDTRHFGLRNRALACFRPRGEIECYWGLRAIAHP